MSLSFFCPAGPGTPILPNTGLELQTASSQTAAAK